MAKQSAATSRKRVRVGYKRKPKGPDWSIDGEYLVWNKGNGKRLNTDREGYDDHYALDNFVAYIKKRLNKKLSDDDLNFFCQNAEEIKIKDYFSVGSIIVAGDQFSDAQKMRFLERVSNLQGFKYGRDVASMLSNLRWRSNDFTER